MLGVLFRYLETVIYTYSDNYQVFVTYKVQKFGVGKIFFTFLKDLCLPSLHLLDSKYSKTTILLELKITFV